MKMTYALINKLIVKGKDNPETFDPEELRNKMDIFLVAGRLTEEEYSKLSDMLKEYESNEEEEISAE